MIDNQSNEEWLALRHSEAKLIDPETAEINFSYRQVLDPYGLDRDFPDELFCVGRAYFARRPGSDIWVWFGDLPGDVCNALWKRVHGDWPERFRRAYEQWRAEKESNGKAI